MGSSTNTNTECETSNIKQPTVEVYVEKTQVQQAEIVWLLKLITSGFSNKSCAKLSETLPCMFTDSDIVKGFKLSRTKAQYTVNHGIAPHIRTLKTNRQIVTTLLGISFMDMPGMMMSLKSSMTISDLDPKKRYQISMDGTNVNLKFDTETSKS